MDNEMINRVAEAILNTPNASDYKTLVACNAIKAMREPTENMLMNEIRHSSDPYGVWTNMIDCIVND